MSRNMSSPLVGLDDARGQVEAGVGSVELEPYRDFEFNLQTSTLRCAGYSVSEVSDLLTLYREHLAKMTEFAHAQNAVMHEAMTQPS